VDRRAWRQAIGFSETNTDNHFTTIDYCIYLSPFRVEIYEKGARRGTFGRYSMGDTFGISRENGKIHYKRNGETFYVSSKTSTEKLMVDASLYFRRSRFANVVVSENFGSTGQAPDALELAALTALYNEMAVHPGEGRKLAEWQHSGGLCRMAGGHGDCRRCNSP
jgi:hypothetical protein